MATSIHEGAHEFQGNVSFSGNMYPPNEAINNDHVSSDATKRIACEKMKHRFHLFREQVAGADVVSETLRLRVCRGAGEIIAVRARPYTAPTGGDKQFTVDVKKAADGSSSFSTLLQNPLVIDSSSTDETVEAATLIASPVTVADDVLQLVITASGSTGSQGDGVIVEIDYEEAPQ